MRIHADVSAKPLLKQLFAGRVQSYFDAVCGPPAPPRNPRLFALPPVDVEDEATIDRLDRTWLWTTYRRSPVIMASPWLRWDEFADRTYNCMSRGCEWVLSLKEADCSRSAAAARKLMISAVVLALQTLQLYGAAQAAAYLKYHRDWLLRFLLRDPGAQEVVLQQFARGSGRRRAALEQIRRLQPSTGHGSSFATALSDLAIYLESVSGGGSLRSRSEVSPVYSRFFTTSPIRAGYGHSKKRTSFTLYSLRWHPPRQLPRFRWE